jgi:arginine-tRNA-protein transferase
MWIIDWHTEETIRLGLKYVYLGYWIKESPKMSYKSKFIGLEKLTNNTWKNFKD